ncbi:hypothetical protein LVO79_01745 [Roseivivax marinus]|uniref:hypothetical protein n=1 Tax=Roseivivax marinus TaxID=1379903 RepID=UPI001F03E18E|nr:hypothetical protein [Roseivivax marinus]UMA65223.1 hypothetical protein LVO79_01745 [Roseivivax marinus]
MRTLLAALVLSTAALPAMADSVTGTVAAYDRVDNVLVLDDRTIWSLETLAEVPEGLSAGKEVTISYTSNADNGWQKINAIEVKG